MADMHLLAILGAACLWCTVTSCLFRREWRRLPPPYKEDEQKMEHAVPSAPLPGVDEEAEDKSPPPSYAEAAVLTAS